MNSKFILIILFLTVSLFSVETDKMEYDEIVSQIKYYTSNPLNINKATISDIYSLPYLDEITAERIYERIESKGPVENLKILVDENILNKDYADKLKRCVVFDDRKKKIERSEYSLRAKRTLEASRAYNDSVYLGNRSLFTQKISYFSEQVTFNMLMDKEPGEINYTDNMKGNITLRKRGDYMAVLGNFNLNSFTGMLQKDGVSFDQYSFRSSNNFHDFVKPSLSSNDYAGYNGTAGFYSYKDYRVTGFYGIKYISASLNEEGEILSVNLNAYSRTVTEIERFHNTKHEISGAGIEGKNFGFKYKASVSKENFSRDLDETSSLFEATAGELSLSRILNKWGFTANAGTDFDKINLKLNALMKTKDLTTDFFYGYIQKEKFSLTSPDMMYGSGDEEQVFGMKFNIKMNADLIIISENLIYSTKYYGTGFPGAQFSLKSNIRRGNLSFEPVFSYKYKESADKNFISSETTEYSSKIKTVYELKLFSIFFDTRYIDNNKGGFGYLLSSGITWKSERIKIRTGSDIYYSKKGAALSSSIADIGKYPSSSSFSGLGRKSYVMIAYNNDNYEISFGISRHTQEDGESSGSGYDIIDSDTVHEAEIDFRYLF